MNTPAAGVMVLVILVGVIAYGALERTVDAVAFMVGVAALLAGWFSSDHWTAADWVIAIIIATYVALVVVCSALAHRQAIGGRE